MKIWLIVMQADHTWIEDAWDDNTTADNYEGWKEAVDKARKTAYENSYELRVIPIEVEGIYEAFEMTPLKGRIETEDNQA